MSRDLACLPGCGNSEAHNDRQVAEPSYPCHVLFNICDLRFYCSRNAGDGNAVKKTLRMSRYFFDPFTIGVRRKKENKINPGGVSGPPEFRRLPRMIKE